MCCSSHVRSQCAVLQLIQRVEFSTSDSSLSSELPQIKYLLDCFVRLQISSTVGPGYVLQFLYKSSSRHQTNNELSVKFKGVTDKFCSMVNLTAPHHVPQVKNIVSNGMTLAIILLIHFMEFLVTAMQVNILSQLKQQHQCLPPHFFLK